MLLLFEIRLVQDFLEASLQYPADYLKEAIAM